MSTSSNSASLRFFAMSWTQRATASALRPGRVLPTMIANLIIDPPTGAKIDVEQAADVVSGNVVLTYTMFGARSCTKFNRVL